MMNLRFASVFISSSLATLALAQQPQNPLPTPVVPPPATPPPVTAPENQPTAGERTTPANQGVLINPTADPNFPGLPAVNTNQTGGNAPLFLNVTPTTITDSTGAPIGVLQQLALSPSGTVNFAIINAGGRMVPVPWQLVVAGTGGARGTLAVNTNGSFLQTAPPVLMGQLPMLTDEDVQAQILSHFGLLPRAQSSAATTTAPRAGIGRPPGLGVTITGGAGTVPAGTPFGTNNFGTTTNLNTNAIPNNTRTNQAVNTTGGLLSPTGRTNAAYDAYNSGPGSTDRYGPRPNANPVPPPPSAVPPRLPNSPQQ